MKPVLLVSTSAAPGGAEQALVRLARLLPSVGWLPTVALLEHGPLEQALAEGGCATVVLQSGRTREVHRTVWTIGRLNRLARRLGVAAILSNMSRSHVYGGIAALTARVPAVWWQHWPPGRTPVDLVSARVPAREVAVVSEHCAAAQRRLTPRLEVVVISGGAPVASIAARAGAGAALRGAESHHGGPLVGVVARLHPSKGQDVFLAAVTLLSCSYPGLRAAVVGGALHGLEGTYEADLHAQARALGIDDRVRFVGHVDDPIPWLDALDVVVLPTYMEGLPLVLMEAMALGKPVVASAVGGVPELVEDGRSGLLVPPGDPDALATAIRQVIDDPALARRLGDEGRRRAAAFSEERTAERMATLLNRVTA